MWGVKDNKLLLKTAGDVSIDIVFCTDWEKLATCVGWVFWFFRLRRAVSGRSCCPEAICRW